MANGIHSANARFFDMVQQAFSFLEHSGFHLTNRAPSRLRYESAPVFVSIEWEARSGELNAWVGHECRTKLRKKVSSGRFSTKLAQDMQVHAQPAMAGDRVIFLPRGSADRLGEGQARLREATHGLLKRSLADSPDSSQPLVMRLWPGVEQIRRVHRAESGR
jgi:hypothetical protein